MNERVMSIDFGTKRIGVAICDSLGVTCRSLGNVSISGKKEGLQRILEMIGKESPDSVVVGVPLNMDGSEGEMARKARRFAEELGRNAGIPVHTIDERLTTREAERILISGDVRRNKRREVIDGLAATIILRKYLDRQVGKVQEDENI